MKNIILLLLVALFAVSCSSSTRSIFSNKTPRESYEDHLDDKDLDETPEGRAWLAASEAALVSPLAVKLPYGQQGYFRNDKPRALGLQFQAKLGTRLTFRLSKKEKAGAQLFADVFKKDGEKAKLLLSADTAYTEFFLDVDEDGQYILRIQPRLKEAGNYRLSISVGPSLGFPVAGSKAKVGSIWGDSRDGGKRNHEGIDIFAPKLTPAVAASDGYIIGVKEGGLGGKTVWLRPVDKAYTLYYAHLDKQLVKEGQFVQKGDVVGLVGNTGNAKYTPSHLHFGIYGFGGAIDPLPFVMREVKAAPEIPDKKLNQFLKLTRNYKTERGEVVKANTVVVPLAVTSSGYIAELPDGRLIKPLFDAVKITDQIPTGTDLATTTSVVGKKS